MKWPAYWQSATMSSSRKLLYLWGIWLLAYFLPMTAGEFWDTYFDPCQASVALLLLISVLKLGQGWWVKDLAAVLVLQMFLNVGDALENYTWSAYDQILTSLNLLEFALLFVGGGITELIRMKRRVKSAVNKPNSGPRSLSSAHVKQESSGA